MKMQSRLIAAIVSLMVFSSSFAADLTLKECSLNTRPVGLNEMVFTADGTDYMQLSDDLQRVERYDIKSGKLLSVVMDTKELSIGTVLYCLQMRNFCCFIQILRKFTVILLGLLFMFMILQEIISSRWQKESRKYLSFLTMTEWLLSLRITTFMLQK